jgi:hypothetical protein
MTVVINDSNLAPPQMEINGTLQHSWLLLCALSASPVAHATTKDSQPLHHISPAIGEPQPTPPS